LFNIPDIGGPVKCAKDVIKKHGLLGMFRGITPMCFRDVFPYGIYMLVYDRMLNIESDVLDKQRKFVGGSGCGQINSHLEMTLTALAGATAGVLSWLFVVPFDVAKTVMQADFRYKSMYHCMHEIVKKNGWQALFRGSFIVIARAIPVNAATFLGYEYCLDKCYKSFPIDDPVPKNNFHFFS
jgi:Mitochondrial carrier protein